MQGDDQRRTDFKLSRDVNKHFQVTGIAAEVSNISQSAGTCVASAVSSKKGHGFQERVVFLPILHEFGYGVA